MRILSILLIFLSGCSLLQEEPKPAPAVDKPWVSPSAQEVAIQPLSKPEEFTDVEITLEAPETPVEGFFIQWGSSPDALLQNQRVAVSELEKAPPSEGKELYVYRLRDIKNSEKLFISVASFVGEEFSEPTGPIEVK